MGYHAKNRNVVAPHHRHHLRIWEECLRVQGELKRKFDEDDDEEKEMDDKEGDGKSAGKRRLVSLFEANEVARRLAGSHNARANGAGVQSDIVSQWM